MKHVGLFSRLIAIFLISLPLLSACQSASPQATVTPIQPPLPTPGAAAPATLEAIAPITGLAPDQVVEGFLSALLKDDSGQSALSYLTQAVQADIRSGRMIADLVTVQKAYPSFEIKGEPLINPDGTARVIARLNYVTPVERSFWLNEESGEWRINTMIGYNLPVELVTDNIRAADQVLLDYFRDLNASRTQEAWALLFEDQQAQLTEARLAEEAKQVTGISPTSFYLLDGSPGKMIYFATFFILSAGETKSGWTTGPNYRYIEVISGDNGWRISQLTAEQLPKE